MTLRPNKNCIGCLRPHRNCIGSYCSRRDREGPREDELGRRISGTWSEDSSLSGRHRALNPTPSPCQKYSVFTILLTSECLREEPSHEPGAPHARNMAGNQARPPTKRARQPCTRVNFAEATANTRHAQAVRMSCTHVDARAAQSISQLYFSWSLNRFARYAAPAAIPATTPATTRAIRPIRTAGTSSACFTKSITVSFCSGSSILFSA